MSDILDPTEHARRYVHKANIVTKPRSAKIIRPKTRRRADTRLDRSLQVDGRTVAGRSLIAFRNDLLAHCGGEPTPAERAAIESACQLKLRILSFDLKYADDGDMSAHAGKQYLAWVNSLRLTLKALGPERKPRAEVTTVADIIARAKRKKENPDV